MEIAFLLLLLFALFCNAAGIDPVIGMIYITSYFIVGAIILFIPLSIINKILMKKIIKQQKIELKKKYPNAKPLNEFLKDLDK